jgi:hypothetical protein
MPARFARQAGAGHHGLVAILGLQGAPLYPVIWVMTDRQLGVAVSDEDEDLSEVLKVIVAHYLAVFFADIVAVAPELAAIRLKADGPRHRGLN